MQKTLKKIISMMLRPAAHFAGFFEASLSRLWNHTRLAALIEPSLDPSVVVLGVPEIRGTGNIRFGRSLFLYPGLYLETQDQGMVVLGDDVVISRGAHIVAFSSVTVGSGSMIGEYVSIRDANHRFGHGLKVRESGHEAQPIRIGSNVWIGRGAVVLPGMQVGDNAVVGANAVVSRDVPADFVVAGVPARPIRRIDSND